MEMVCEAITLSLPALPPRSRLYSLEPVGLGTAGVESLVSYVTRLAGEHGASNAVLFGWEIAPLMRRSLIRGKAQGTGKSSLLAVIFRGKAHPVNGTGVTAEDWLRVIEALTLREDLCNLTLLPWKGALSHKGQIRPERAWCPACYEERRVRGKIIYEPLLWSLEPVTACPRHRRRLRTACQHCGRLLHPLESYHRPGFCSACGGWLGVSPGESLSEDEALAGAELEWQSWVSAVLGEMLAAAPYLPCEPSREAISASTMACLRRMTPGGSGLAFCRTLGVSEDAIGNWRRGESRADFHTLLQVCSKVGVTPLKFLTGTLDIPEEDKSRRTEGRRAGTLAGTRRWRSIQTEEVEKALEASLKEDPPPSMIGIARRLKRPASALRYRFPLLCAAIVSRYAEHAKVELEQRRDNIRRALELALQENDCSSVEEVARGNGWHLGTLIEIFPELCKQISERHAEHIKDGWSKIRGELETVLKENPPPPMREVTTRFSCSETSLYSHFPDLCSRIAKRHKEYRKKEVIRRRERFLLKVRKAALTLHAEGIYPSVKQVGTRLGRPESLKSDKGALAVLREVRSALNLHAPTLSN